MRKSTQLSIVLTATLAVNALAALPATAAQHAQVKTVTVTDRDNNETVQLNVGDKLAVRLASNPSTGYSWKVGQINQQLLRLTGDPRFEASSSGLLGAPGTEVFEFEARAPGGEALALLYQNPTLRGVQAANTFRLRVVISDPAKPGKTIVLTDADNNESLTVAEGDTVIVRLSSTPSTGYSWSIAENVDLILQPEGSRYVRGASRPGASGYQEFTFMVVGNGEAPLKMLYQRPWQRSTQAAQAWQVFIESPRTGEQPVAATPAATPAAPTAVVYVCAGGTNFAVVFGATSARVTYSGATMDLPQQEVADGFLYADSVWELRGKGNAATLTDLATKTPVGEDCTAQPSAAESAPTTILTNYACDDGVTFTATFGGDVASVTLKDETKTLKQQEAADGFLYSDGAWELRGVGSQATLIDLASGQPMASNCKTV
jgi:inhibitor of cysteine peptidase